MNNNGKRGLAEQNRTFFNKKRLNNGVVNGGRGSGSSNEEETRFNKVAENGNKGLGGQVQINESLQISQPPPQGPVVCWERFLPVRSIKVLLVEDDDPTRNIVCALLRNCGYEVTAVSNGLQAWKILKDLENHIDLVLTEVTMPILSGVGLLCKIMSHKTLKNIPVIMTSSYDSMGIVFKCLSKGAVDFLVKPIRRNELKNLWQHVWRRCHSSSGSGSGSESGTHTRKCAKTVSKDASENNSDSSDENDGGSKGLSLRDGSDNGSGTQSTWTKCLVQVASPHPVSPHKQSVDAPDSTCAQVMHTKTEQVSSSWVHAAEKECHQLVNCLDNVAMGKDLAIGISSNIQLEQPLEELSINPLGKGSDVDGKQLNKGHSNVCDKGQPEEYGGDKSRKQENEVVNIADVTGSNSPQAESRDLNTPNGFSGFSQTKASGSFKQHPSLELTLKRMGEVRDAKNVTADECNVLRHSNLSAFSKYNTATSVNQAQTGNVGSCSPLGNSSVVPNTEMLRSFPSHSNSTPPNQQSNESNNNNDMASTNTYLGTKPRTLEKKPESVRGIGSSNSSALHTMQKNSIFLSQKKASSGQEEYAETVKGQVGGGSEQGLKAEHDRYQIHGYNHITLQAALDLRSDQYDLLMKSSSKAAQQCVSSNVVGGPAESNAINYGVDGNAAESGHGSNGQDGSSNNTLTIRTIDAENGNVTSGTGVGGIDRKNIGNGADEGRIALREAALNKFRQKRKERCFEKKVRYHSRKKLAEQRPRIRGQFVRRIVSDKEKDKQSDNNLVSADNSSDSPR